uniref:F-box domain-containing protein n=1 Tax=Parascaris equorum TaxID=6256 RepID=A0A914RUX9_PAREQ
MDDAWRRVFEMLSTIERIRCERVCRKWRNLLREQWKITTSVDTETACRGVPPHQWSICIENIIGLTDHRCSDRIVTFMFGARANNLKVFPTKVELNENIFEKILLKSPKLRVFQVTNSLVPLISLSMFERMPCSLQATKHEHFNHSLQVFRLESCVIDVNKPEIVRYSLMQMFQRCASLKEFTMTGRGSCYGHLVIDDYLLKEIPDSIEKLSISAGDSLKIRDASFIQHLRK